MNDDKNDLEWDNATQPDIIFHESMFNMQMRNFVFEAKVIDNSKITNSTTAEDLIKMLIDHIKWRI